MGIALGDVRVNCRNQLRDTAKNPATNLFGREVSKDAFDQVEPRTAGGCEMHVDARVAPQPPLDRRVCVRGVIVGDQMQGLALGDLAINQTKKSQPFLVPMAWQTRRDDRALGDIQGGKECGGAMALVIVRHRAAATGLEGQAGLRAIQRLDLAFLIHAEDDGMLGRVQIQAHHILQLVLEVRIPAEFKGPDPMGLQAMGGPDSLHERGVRAQVPGQGAGRPVGGGGRCRVGRRLQNACGESLARLGGTPSARRILGKADQALGGEALPPEAHGLPTRVQGGGNVLVVVAVGRQQGDLRAKHEPCGRPSATSPLRKLLAFSLCHLKGRGDAHGPVLRWRRAYPYRIICQATYESLH